ncbi:MAG: Nif3-like dinuclear metal center hexameric protein [Spirochaetales bacterium]|nr:MAG: Nif3-like dinuclear metal center hexameric protein [Spirochaetales bacterium]
MKLSEFDSWARERLEFDVIDSIDASMNGIQVGDPDMDISRMVFAVDACMDSFQRAAAEGAQALFVHHGLFWGPAMPLTGVLGERVRFLMNNNMALYACHLPLDRHAELGNNARMVQLLGLGDVQPFGEYKGRHIGFKGVLPKPEKLETLIERLFGFWDERINALRFGPRNIRTVGMISGGGTREVSQAIAHGLDLYITGDSSHNIYHECREAGINVLFAGHYLTEIFGVQAMAEEAASVLGLDTLFIDIPTGY